MYPEQLEYMTDEEFEQKTKEARLKVNEYLGKMCQAHSFSRTDPAGLEFVEMMRSQND